MGPVVFEQVDASFEANPEIPKSIRFQAENTIADQAGILSVGILKCLKVGGAYNPSTRCADEPGIFMLLNAIHTDLFQVFAQRRSACMPIGILPHLNAMVVGQDQDVAILIF